MKILLNNNDLNEALYSVSNIGFIPTMGSLHNGHISLIKKSLRECNRTIVSIFINPTQFNSKKDFNEYPRNNKKDLIILKKLGVNFVYMPNQRDIYTSKRRKKIKLNHKDKVLCAKFRKGHFEGVIDVMDRFTELLKPKKIYMGEKDYQQFYLVKKFLQKKHKSKIILCKTIRDNNKLALSSRNFLLNRKDKLKAGRIARNLMNFKKKITKKNLNKLFFEKKKELKKFFNVKVEYLELRNKHDLKISNNIKNSKIFIAYFMNTIRLIDNF
tara:strand:- start:106 stop:915 length:810 start_codon:yes stop_codon:yes gene_type:complete